MSVKDDKLSKENSSEMDDENRDEYTEEEEEESIKDERLKRILKKFNLKNDDQLPYKIEELMKRPDLTQEDINDFSIIYFNYIKSY